MAQQTIEGDLKTEKHIITRYLSNEHKNPQEHANILHEISMPLSQI